VQCNKHIHWHLGIYNCIVERYSIHLRHYKYVNMCAVRSPSSPLYLWDIIFCGVLVASFLFGKIIVAMWRPR
jgi:hypothetical protein